MEIDVKNIKKTLRAKTASRSSHRSRARQELLRRLTAPFSPEVAEYVEDSRRNYRASFRPQTPEEHALIDSVVTSHALMLRAGAIEDELLKREVHRLREEFPNCYPAQFEHAIALRNLCAEGDLLQVAMRFSERASREVDRATCRLITLGRRRERESRGRN